MKRRDEGDVVRVYSGPMVSAELYQQALQGRGDREQGGRAVPHREFRQRDPRFGRVVGQERGRGEGRWPRFSGSRPTRARWREPRRVGIRTGGWEYPAAHGVISVSKSLSGFPITGYGVRHVPDQPERVAEAVRAGNRTGASRLRESRFHRLRRRESARPDAAREMAGVPAVAGSFNKQNAEAYGAIVENEFRSPLVAPLSTFSADVNTASYANVRRFLNRGQAAAEGRRVPRRVRQLLPLPATRSPKGDDPVAFNARDGAVPVEAEAPPRPHRRAGAARSPPTRCRRATSCSSSTRPGSMAEPNRLPLVKQSLELLVDQLTEKDRVSIVTYAGDAGLALAADAGRPRRTTHPGRRRPPAAPAAAPTARAASSSPTRLARADVHRRRRQPRHPLHRRRLQRRRDRRRRAGAADRGAAAEQACS